MSDTSDDTPHELANDDGEIWDGGRRDLENKLADWYGIESLSLMGDWYDEERDEMLYEVLVLYDGEKEHLVAEGVPVFGHGPSGAAGVYADDLPPKDEVTEVS